MIYEVTESSKPLRESEVTRVETILGVMLPTNYKRFLGLHNGGRPHPDSFAIQTEIHDSSGKIDFFLCIDDGNLYDLIPWVARYKMRIPGNLIPIAVDPGGNLICLGIKGEDAEKVYFWDHENEALEGKQPSHENIYVIADTFDDFVAGFE